MKHDIDSAAPDQSNLRYLRHDGAAASAGRLGAHSGNVAHIPFLNRTPALSTREGFEELENSIAQSTVMDSAEMLDHIRADFVRKVP